ncbi:MAG TPA: tetratricopeptide repeat protein [bacterium]|jgi:tetratricopeptide (TPR) repeat protein
MKPFRLASVIILFAFLLLAAGLVLHAQDTKDSVVIPHYNASLAQEANGKYADALKEMEAIPTNARSDYAVVLRFGWLEYMNAKYDLAEKYYRQAVAAAPKSVEALLGLTLPLAAVQDWTQVEATYHKVLALEPVNYTAHLRLGQMYMNRGDNNAAAAHFANALEHYPAAYEAVLSSGWNEFSLGNKDAARRLFERALMMSPGDTSALRGLSGLK